MAEKAVNAFAENGGSKYVMNKKSNGTYERKKISFDSDAIESLETNALPKVTGSDNGKALIVSSGKWAKKNIPSQLPTVTGSDEGKVLTVDSSGNWVAGAAGGGGGDVFNVTGVFSMDGGMVTITLNKTYNEIKTAVIAGSVIVIYVESSMEDSDGEITTTYMDKMWASVAYLSESYIDNELTSAKVVDNHNTTYTVSSLSDYPVFAQA